MSICFYLGSEDCYLRVALAHLVHTFYNSMLYGASCSIYLFSPRLLRDSENAYGPFYGMTLLNLLGIVRGSRLVRMSLAAPRNYDNQQHHGCVSEHEIIDSSYIRFPAECKYLKVMVSVSAVLGAIDGQ